MTRPRPRALVGLAVAVLVLVLGACGDGGDDESADAVVAADDTTSDDTSGASDATATDGTAADAGPLPDACTLVEAVEVENLIGSAAGENETDTAIDGLDYSQCTWENDEGLLIVAVVDGPERYEMHAETLPGEPVEGVGEEAITAPGVSSETSGATGGRTISALVDGRTLVVAVKVPGQTSVDLVAPIATAVASRLAA